MGRAAKVARWCTAPIFAVLSLFSGATLLPGCTTDRVDLFTGDGSAATLRDAEVSDAGVDADMATVADVGVSRCDDPALIACYRFEDDTVAAPDPSLSLSATGSSFEPGVFGRGLTLSSETLANAPGPAFEVSSLSLDAWVRIDTDPSAAVPPVRYIAQRGSSWAARLEVIEGVLVFSCVTTSGSSFVGPLFPGSWHHVACLFDGSNALAYLDGVPALVARTSLDAAGAAPLNVGHSSFDGDTPMQGGIDELRIWSVVLSGSDVADAATPP